MAQGHKIGVSFGYLVLIGISLCMVSASESPFGALHPPSTTTTTTATSTTTTQAPVESSTSTPILSGSNETLAHSHDNLNGTEEHDHHEQIGELNHHHHNTLPGLANSSLQSDKLSSHGHSDAPSVTFLSSVLLAVGLALGTFVI